MEDKTLQEIKNIVRKIIEEDNNTFSKKCPPHFYEKVLDVPGYNYAKNYMICKKCGDKISV